MGNLTITRKVGEQTFLKLPDGRTIAVKVGVIKGDRVRLSFEAPDDVKIHRDEHYNQGGS